MLKNCIKKISRAMMKISNFRQFTLTSVIITNFAVLLSGASFILQTKRDLFSINENILEPNYVLWSKNAKICFKECSKNLPNATMLVSAFSEDSQKCNCYSSKREKLIDFSKAEKNTRRSWIYSSEFL